MDANKTITATFKEIDTIYPYPNPANDNVKIYSNNTINIVNIKVIDLSGKVIIETANEEINISHLNSGLYMLRITDSNNKTTVKKLIKD